jgi:hypothetical protein
MITSNVHSSEGSTQNITDRFLPISPCDPKDCIHRSVLRRTGTSLPETGESLEGLIDGFRQSLAYHLATRTFESAYPRFCPSPSHVSLSFSMTPPTNTIKSPTTLTLQSTSTPLDLSSLFANSISRISSLCASGTSLNVNTPQPSLKSRYAPKETMVQNGSCTRAVKRR